MEKFTKWGPKKSAYGKDLLEAFPRILQRIRSFYSQMKGNSHQRVHPNCAKNLGKQIIAIPSRVPSNIFRE